MDPEERVLRSPGTVLAARMVAVAVLDRSQDFVRSWLGTQPEFAAVVLDTWLVSVLLEEHSFLSEPGHSVAEAEMGVVAVGAME